MPKIIFVKPLIVVLKFTMMKSITLVNKDFVTWAFLHDPRSIFHADSKSVIGFAVARQNFKLRVKKEIYPLL